MRCHCSVWLRTKPLDSLIGEIFVQSSNFLRGYRLRCYCLKKAESLLICSASVPLLVSRLRCRVASLGQQRASRLTLSSGRQALPLMWLSAPWISQPMSFWCRVIATAHIDAVLGYQKKRSVELSAIAQKFCRKTIQRILSGEIRAIGIAFGVVY